MQNSTQNNKQAHGLATISSLCKNGYVVVTSLVFTGVFLMILYSLVGLVLTQFEKQQQEHRVTESLQIAEAGLDWYRWYLAHNPNDFDGPEGEMPYEKTITDPERGDIGTAKIDINESEYCGKTQWVDITATGWSKEQPSVTRTVSARYTRPSVARYSYILNSNVWAGSDREINGPYHSNGGIRMDGNNNSKVTSAKSEWECDDEFGCSSSGEIKPGVFGDGSGHDLWEFPVPQVDFTGITLDLNQMRDLAKSKGVHLNAIGGQSGHRGWRVVFNGDRSVDVYQVQKTDSVTAFSEEEGWHKNRNIITQDKFDGTRDLPDNCPVIFAEDKLWIEGELGNKITVASAKPKNPNFQASMIINDSITYTSNDAGLTAVAEKSVDIPLTSPDTMKVNGIFVAQNGRFGRDHFVNSNTSPYFWRWVGNQYDEYVKRSDLTINGSVVSNGRVGTKWSDSDGNWLSGYKDRTNSFDQDLSLDPPPLTPFVSDQYEFVRWREQQ